MASEIFSAKVQELDQEMMRLHDRIQGRDYEDIETVRRTIADLEKELQGKRKELEEKLGHSKAKSVAKIMVFYREMTQELTKLQEERKREVEENGDSVLAAEKKALWAEYGLDFAMQVANSALLAALKAVDAQLTLEEKNW